ncbi:fimbrial assembly protein [Paraburkholderia sp. BCC1884]|uniref:fimbrial assembly protein n=1 Tax=Paraburkholderia sp. BCC1884 TaxID=2562668 RepID=UPI0011833C41|nr:fimbrial assembly protein [Paraburkholderia sp. BCC1884]
MMRGLLSAAYSDTPAATRGLRFARPWLGGFNLLPYRQRNARLARRRRVHEWFAATCSGGAAVLALAGWQALETAHLDARRVAVDHSLAQLSVPLTEHATLQRTRDEQRKGAARAKTLSDPLTYLRDLLDMLSFEPGDGVVLQQLRQREYETELLATSSGHLASAEWLKRLGGIRGVKEAEVSDLHRVPLPGNAATAASVNVPIEFGARLRWDGAVQKGSALASRAVKSEQSRGGK